MKKEAKENQESLYTVTLAQVRVDNSLKHDHVLTTSDKEEATKVRNQLNERRPFFGSRGVAQLIRKEIKPRQWSLYAYTSSCAVHLRCAWTNARGLLRQPTLEIIEKLRNGCSIPDELVALQSERIQVGAEKFSTRRVSYIDRGGAYLTKETPIRESTLAYLDVSSDCQLINDNFSGAVARHSFEGDLLTLPERFARLLWSEGIILPIRCRHDRSITVRLADPELRSRLHLWRHSVKPVTLAPPKRIPHIDGLALASVAHPL